MGKVVPARTLPTLHSHPLPLYYNHPIQKCPSASIVMTSTLINMSTCHLSPSILIQVQTLPAGASKCWNIVQVQAGAKIVQNSLQVQTHFTPFSLPSGWHQRPCSTEEKSCLVYLRAIQWKCYCMLEVIYIYRRYCCSVATQYNRVPIAEKNT